MHALDLRERGAMIRCRRSVTDVQHECRSGDRDQSFVAETCSAGPGHNLTVGTGSFLASHLTASRHRAQGDQAVIAGG
jgi:hypothetical protein